MSEKSEFPYIDFERDGEMLQPVYGEGMTLRQWYKGMALQGLCASGDYTFWADIVQHAGSLADAMLAEDAQHEEQSDETDAVPNPGSTEAVAQGCTCPMLDNALGRGWPVPGQYWIAEGCPVHCPQPASFCEEQSDGG